MSDDEALRLFDAAVDKRLKSGLFRVEGEGDSRGLGFDSNGTVSNNLEETPRRVRRGLGAPPVHGTGDGFDGATADLLGPAVLVEQHRRLGACRPAAEGGDEANGRRDSGVSQAPMEQGAGRTRRVPRIGRSGERRRRRRRRRRRTSRTRRGRAADEAAAKEGKDTHRRVVVREPGENGLRFGLWLTGRNTWASSWTPDPRASSCDGSRAERGC